MRCTSSPNTRPTHTHAVPLLIASPSVSASMASPYSAPRVRAGLRTHLLALGSRRRSQAPCARPRSCPGRHSSNSLLPHHGGPAAATYNLAPPVTPVTPVVTPVHRWPRWCLTDRDNQASRCGSPSAPSLPQTLSRIVVSFRRPTSERARSRLFLILIVVRFGVQKLQTADGNWSHQLLQPASDYVPLESNCQSHCAD